MFELMTGERPFTASSDDAMHDGQRSEPPFGVDSHESNNKLRICRVKYEVRAGGVYFVRVSAKDLHDPLRYELKIQSL